MTGKDLNYEEGIDLIELVKKLIRNKKLIIKITFIFFIFAIFIALFSPKEYTAYCVMVPQTGEKSSGGSLSGLAAMAGINLGNMVSSEILSPLTYPKIIENIKFQKELISKPLKFEDYNELITFYDYYTDEKYRKFNLINSINKYTIGLPGVIRGLLRGKQEEVSYQSNVDIEIISKKEKDVIKILKGIVDLDVNEKEGVVTLSVSMPEPLAAAQLACFTQELLQTYITDFKIQKVDSNLSFVQKQYEIAKKDFEEKQKALALFKDSNKSLASIMAQTQEDNLKAEYNLAFSVYSELAKQVEQAKIAVQETTPILTIIQPVVVPIERTKPRRGLICIGFTFLGLIIGISSIFIFPVISEITGNRKWKKKIK